LEARVSDREEVVRRFVTDVWNGEREESAYDLIAAECPGMDGTGPEATLTWHRDRRKAFPDQRYEIVDLVVSDDRAAIRWRGTGTQRGQFGRRVECERAVPGVPTAWGADGATCARCGGVSGDLSNTAS
jgi:hypothetical protein